LDDYYYFNFATGASQWEHPLDDLYRNRVLEERESRTDFQVEQGDGEYDGFEMQARPPPAKLASTDAERRYNREYR
jgi:hypothetical protein